MENINNIKNIINEYKNKILIKNKQSANFNQNKLLFKEINNKYKNVFKNISEIIYLIKNYDNLENCHIFCECGKKNNFKKISQGYTFYCSKKCSNNNKNVQKKKNQIKLNNIDKNGLNSYQRAKLKERQTKLNNIDENGLNSYDRMKIKRKQTMLKDINENGLNAIERTIIKTKQTKKLKYGNENFNNKEKIKQSMLNNIDENGLNGYQRTIQKSRIKKINDIVNGLNGYQRAAKKAHITILNDIKNGLNGYQRIVLKSMKKRYNTMKKNHTFNTSKDEEKCYNLLLNKFNKDDIERQYRSKLYPFHSDFYIKSLDLYIECHFHWTHCPIKTKQKPFKNSIEDLQELEKLKNKNSKYYNIALNIWSKIDPLKLQTFKKNKLNYKIFYKFKQFENWCGKING